MIKAIKLILLFVNSYETANGIRADENGSLKRANSPDKTDVIVAQGSYSYTSPEGQLIQVRYTADDDGGFQAVGDHLVSS